jgi:NADPH2:quinone reductase
MNTATVGAIRVLETGGPEKMVWARVELPTPGPGQVLVRNTAIGLNFVDTYYRGGLYPIAVPFTPGSEGVGIVEALGPRVKGLKVGDRVGYVDPIGSYAEALLRPAERLVKLPKGISDMTAAAVLLKGMTAEYLLRRTYRVKKGETILVHAAAGGVGLILCQWAKALGVVVIGTVGSEEKAALAKKAGCKHVIVTSRTKFVEEVKNITKGKGVSVVYDGVGKDTFMDSLDCLRPTGLMVSFGSASGPVTSLDTGILARKGSLFLTRPTLSTYVASKEDLQKSASELFKAVQKGVVKVSINQTYALKDAAQAHRDLEGRKTTGSTLLLPG